MRDSQLDTYLQKVQLLITAATFDNSRWLDVLETFQVSVGGEAAALSLWRRESPAILGVKGATWSEQATSEYVSFYGALDTITPAFAVRPDLRAKILPEITDLTAFRNGEFFNDWAGPHGVAYLAAISFPIDATTSGVLTINRSAIEPRFHETERVFMENLALYLQRSLALQRAIKLGQMGLHFIDKISAGIVLLDERGGVRYCNPSADRILSQGRELSRRKDRLRADNATDQANLDHLIGEALGGYISTRSAGVVIRRTLPATPLLVRALTVSREFAHELIGEYVPSALFITDFATQEPSLVRHVETLRQLWRLTEKPAYVACRWADGASYECIAEELGIGVETVRSHLKRAYSELPLRKNTQLELYKFIKQLDLPFG